MDRGSPYPPIADYAMLGDCHSAALVSRGGSVDWWCAPRFDSGSCFARLLDRERGGFFQLEPEGDGTPHREYLERTLVLRTTFRTDGGEASVTDCLLVPPSSERGDERRRLLRVVDGGHGAVRFSARLAPRFDYGEVAPWIRSLGGGAFGATGGDDGLVVWSDARLEAVEGDAVAGGFSVRPGERVRLLATFVRPEEVHGREDEWRVPEPRALDRALEEAVRWWRDWAASVRVRGGSGPIVRSAIVLKALSYRPTGAIAAAATTSLPESPEGTRTWDYRYSWVRDAALSGRSLARLGCEEEADGFRRFVERTAAGNAAGLRILYGVGGERRLAQMELSSLDGWRGAGPVRTGNDAAAQTQLDSLGHVLVQSWRWHLRGHAPDDDYWRFLHALVDSAVERWREPDAGIWEWRGEPRHFVHSKIMCWAAVDRGLRLAGDSGRRAPERWRAAREEIRAAVEEHGYDRERGAFVQAFGSSELDAAALRLPTVEFVDWRDERMVGTVNAIREELSEEGLLRRYRADDGLPGREGAFLACSFWLAEVLARQERVDEAREAFERALATANDLGLFSEEHDPERGEMLGNFPQALTHLSHIEAALALAEHGGEGAVPGDAERLEPAR